MKLGVKNRSMNYVTRDELFSKIKLSSGKFVSVRFVKADDTVRDLVGRLGVTKDVKGVGLKYDPDAVGNVIIRDVQKQAYRTIKKDRLLSAKIEGEEYSVMEDDFINE